MNIDNERIRKVIMYYSLQEREKREYAIYEIERSRLEDLTEWELNSKYINTKSKFEYKKNVFTFFIITISLAVLSGLTNSLYSFFEKLIQFISLNQKDSMEIAKINAVIAVMFFIIVVVIIFITLISYLKTLYSLRKQTLMIEEVMIKFNESE